MKLHRLILLIFIIQGLSQGIFAQKEIFLKQIDFKLDEVSDIDYENEYFLTLKLNKGTKYLFKTSNHVEGYVGQAVIELMDADVLIMTNVLGEKYFESVSFMCNKTGFYDVLIRFKDNKPGNSVVDVIMYQ